MRITVELDTAHVGKDGLSLLRLVLVQGGKRSRWSTGLRLAPSAWNKRAKRVRDGVDGGPKINAQVEGHVRRAREIVLDRPGITPKELVAALNVPTRNVSVLLTDALEAAYQAHEHRWRYGTKKGRRTVIADAKTALPHVTLEGFDKPQLLALDRWHVERGAADNTRRSRLRRFGTMYALACEMHGLTPKVRPAKLAPAEVKTIKTFLSAEQVAALRTASWDLPTANMRLAAHAWLLQYDLGGLRFNEVCRLHTDMRKGDAYRWVEGKVPKPRYHPIRPNAQAIVDYYAGKGRVLPLVPEELTGDEFDRAVESANTMVNRELKKICEFLGLPRVTTHNARHSAAQRIKTATDIHAASRILGHATVKQTQAYLDDLDTSPIDRAFDELDR